MVPTSFCVTLETQHNLGGSVPSCSNIFGHISCILLGIYGESSGQTEIANFQLAIGVHQQIPRLQIAMENIRRVDIFETAKNLVDEGLEMGVGEGLSGSNNGSKIAFHKF